MIKRRKTRTVSIGGVKIGSGYPVRIQSMAKCDTRLVKKVISEIQRQEKAGCEITRVAVKDKTAAKAIATIKKKINIPLVADIHFDYRLALEAIKRGADKIRINPGNITKRDEIKEIIKAAKKRKIPIRIGLNSGSLPQNLQLTTYTSQLIRFFERQDFYDIVLSVKYSDVKQTIDAYRGVAAACGYPMHLGVTAAGSYDMGMVKSSIGIGALLLDGIGDTIRVSLTGDSTGEVAAAKRILQSLHLRKFGPDIISCPTCGRCQVDLVKIVKDFEKQLYAIRYPLNAKQSTIAVMGCEVNGPGEAAQADLGVAFGNGTGVLFRKGKIVKRVKEKDSVKELLKILTTIH